MIIKLGEGWLAVSSSSPTLKSLALKIEKRVDGRIYARAGAG